MMRPRLLGLLMTMSALALPMAATAQNMIGMDTNGPAPVIHSKTVITIMPKGSVPKPVMVRDDSAAPELQKPVEQAPVNPDEEKLDQEPKAQEDGEASADEAEPEAKPAPAAPLAKLEVQVRREQLPLNNGIYTKYHLDASHGVLTYFVQAEPRTLSAENLYEPIDILFIRDDGIIAQIMPNIMLAYLSDDVQVDFPVRAYLYVQAGVADSYGLKPGDRIEHGMFTPSPMLKTE